MGLSKWSSNIVKRWKMRECYDVCDLCWKTVKRKDLIPVNMPEFRRNGHKHTFLRYYCPECRENYKEGRRNITITWW